LTDLASNRGAPPFELSDSRFQGEATSPLSVHDLLPAAAFYIFLNHAGLPNGLFYSTLLSPLLYIWLYLKGQRWLTAKFLLFLAPFIVVHFGMGIAAPLFYLRSLALLWTAYITVYAFCFALLKTKRLDRLFDELIVLNFVAAVLALVNLHTPLSKLFWMDASDTLAGASHLLRLTLLSSEPSVYAELMLPLIIFAALRLLGDGKRRSLLYLCMIALPFLLTQSFGGLSMGIAGIGISMLITYRRLLWKPKTLVVCACLIVSISLLLLTHNPISDRVAQVINGDDSSTQSRTIFSFLAAFSVASSKSLWWGVGLGQAKVVDVSDLGIGFSVGIIPNAVAGTFAEMGIIGVAVRFAVDIFLFFKTRVYRNSFRFAMFVVAFITQLTGSHLMDVQQYLMWCLAFFPFFPVFNNRDAPSLESTY
jgi:hypothetical protein